VQQHKGEYGEKKKKTENLPPSSCKQKKPRTAYSQLMSEESEGRKEKTAAGKPEE
jgi:hypothetical protein